MNIFRLLRIVLGVMIIIQAIMMKDWLFGIAGVIFTAMPLFNIGCCNGTSCNVSDRNKINPTENNKTSL